MRKILQFGAILSVGGVIGTSILYPELKNDIPQLYSASSNALRCANTILSIYFDYKFHGIDEDFHQRSAQKIQNALMKNGGVYIKFGQVLAHLDYLLPYVYVQTLQPCMQACPQSDFQQVKKTIEEDLGQKIDDMFDYFNPIPLASASLAQVHLAILKETGEKVAVKVQHQGLRQSCPGDIRLTRFGIELAYLIFPNFNYR